MKASKQQKDLVLIAKYTIKRNGATVYRVRSNQANKKGRVEGTDQVERNSLWYDAHNVTVYKKETVCGCTCKGSEYRGKCWHRDGIQARLDAKVVKVVTSPVGISEKQEVHTDLSTKGNLNGSRGFSILKIA